MPGSGVGGVVGSLSAHRGLEFEETSRSGKKPAGSYWSPSLDATVRRTQGDSAPSARTRRAEVRTNSIRCSGSAANGRRRRGRRPFGGLGSAEPALRASARARAVRGCFGTEPLSQPRPCPGPCPASAAATLGAAGVQGDPRAPRPDSGSKFAGESRPLSRTTVLSSEFSREKKTS